MKIEAIGLYSVAMPLTAPFRTAFANTEVIESLVVSLSSGGVVGWGESSPWGSPFYCGEWTPAAFLLAKTQLAPRLIGREIGSGDELQELLRPFKDNRFAKAAFDLAWWDLHARRRSVPLCEAVGGKNQPVQVGADFGVMDSVEELLEHIRGAVAAGFPRVKLKIRPGWDVDVIATVRANFPATVFHVDCNSGYTPADIGVFRALDTMNLAMIEQPLAHDDLHDHAKLQAQLKTPICLDESITSPERARHAIETGACRWINIKLGRLGGMTQALKVRALAEAAGIPCWVGGMLESAIGQAHSLALATMANIQYPSDIFPTDRFYSEDLATQPVTLAAPGRIRPFSGPGIGCVPDPRRLARCTRERATFER